MKHRLLLKNAHVLTMDHHNTTADSLLIEGQRIAALGSFSEVSAYGGLGADVLDLNGKTVLPGFIDSHVHLIMTGVRHQQLQLQETRSFDEIFDKIRSWDKEHPGDDWICGWLVNDAKLKEKRMPEAKDLDRAGVSRPVWIVRADGNTSAVNTPGLHQLDFSLDDFSVIKDASGNPTGLFKVPSNFAVRLQMLNSVSPEIKAAALEWVAHQALNRGVTSVHAMEYLDDIRIMGGVLASLPIRVEIYARSDDLTQILNLDLKTIGGDVLLDGTLPSHTAALSIPYADQPSEKGILYYGEKRDALLELMKKARAAGLQSAFHAIGDRGIAMALEILDVSFGNKLPIRHRIEHYTVPNREQVTRTAELGIMVSLVPAAIHHNCREGGAYVRRLGPERVKRVIPLREIFDEGVLAGGSSDSPISEINPIFGIHSAVNAPYEAQRIEPKEALEMFTINNAKLAFKEEEVGSIEVGKYADLVVLQDDPLTIARDQIQDIEVVMTLVGGEIKYKNQEVSLPILQQAEITKSRGVRHK
jgi:predicted amidohydrolase YtcJ